MKLKDIFNNKILKLIGIIIFVSVVISLVLAGFMSILDINNEQDSLDEKNNLDEKNKNTIYTTLNIMSPYEEMSYIYITRNEKVTDI